MFLSLLIYSHGQITMKLKTISKRTVQVAQALSMRKAAPKTDCISTLNFDPNRYVGREIRRLTENLLRVQGPQTHSYLKVLAFIRVSFIHRYIF